MRSTWLIGAALGGAAYWASRQPGGIKGTVDRAGQCLRDIHAGQDPMKVGKRFVTGRDEELAGFTPVQPEATPGLAPQQPFQQQLTEIP